MCPLDFSSVAHIALMQCVYAHTCVDTSFLTLHVYTFELTGSTHRCVCVCVGADTFAFTETHMCMILYSTAL